MMHDNDNKVILCISDNNGVICNDTYNSHHNNANYIVTPRCNDKRQQGYVY